MRGLYIHVPFCRSKCAYCDFYSLPKREQSIGPYIEAVLTEAGKYAGMSFQALYLGGGTPSLLGPANLNNLIKGFRHLFNLSNLVEASMEANPESTTTPILETAINSGINRISIGVQSLSDDELRKVGRIHNATEALDAIKRAKQAGFQNISADVIIGLPGQDWQSLASTLERLINLDIQHISAYCLSVEHGTPLANDPPPDLPSDDCQAELFEKASSLLKECGFTHYEISNFARQGYECQHNVIYWQGGEYIGLGPAAASHLNGKRFKNVSSLNAFLKMPLKLSGEIEELDVEGKAAEEVMLRLRLLEEGLNITDLAQKYGREAVKKLVDRLSGMAEQGLLLRNGPVYCLNPSLVMISNPIFSRVLGE